MILTKQGVRNLDKLEPSQSREAAAPIPPGHVCGQWRSDHTTGEYLCLVCRVPRRPPEAAPLTQKLEIPAPVAKAVKAAKPAKEKKVALTKASLKAPVVR